MDLDTTTPVLVLRVGPQVLHHGSLGIIRSLGRVGVPVYGVHEDRFTPPAVSRYLDGKFIWKTYGQEAREFVDGMAIVAQTLGRPAALIPIDDLGAIMVAENAAILRQWFLFPQQPAELLRALANKKDMYHLCQKLGIPCPKAVFPQGEEDVHRTAQQADFPLMVKSLQPWRLPRQVRRSTHIARTPEQLLSLYRTLAGGADPNLMFQEYIPPDYGQDWIFNSYCDAQSNCLAGFTGIKIRSYPPGSGPMTFGRCVENEALKQQAEQFLRVISYRGAVDLDYRLDLRDGEYKLLDFNPRIGAQFRLFQDEGDMDVARALHLDLTGRSVQQRDPRRRTFLVENHDLLASWGYHCDGSLTVRAWLRSLRHIDETAWFSADDLAPFLMMCMRFLLRGMQHLFRIRPSADSRRSLPRYLPGRRRARYRRTRSDVSA